MHQIFLKALDRRWAAISILLAASLALTGCSHFQVKPSTNYVYVTAKQTFLRDRVAAVSNRSGTAANGEKLVVLDHDRRFLKVRTPSGEVGWIEERLTADQATADKFEALGKQHAGDPVVATATASDEVYLHVAPGRQTEHFYLLSENAPLSLLDRASVLKPAAPGAAPATKLTDTPGAPPAPAMEDWWLVRDAKGQTGWIYGRMLDVSAPDTLLRYANGQRIVGAYVLAHVDDPDSGVLNNGATVTSIPEYLTVLTPYKNGLPYDFNQVRVFIWNSRKHRYETGFSEHNIAGYLPVKTGQRSDPYSKTPNPSETFPSFTYRVLAADQPLPTPDPVTGLIKPGTTIQKTYLLTGNICQRLLAPGTPPPPEAHPDPEPQRLVRGARHIARRAARHPRHRSRR